MRISDKEVVSLELKANEVRQEVIKMLVEAKSGHSAGPLGMADIFTALYFYHLNHKPQHPDWDDRDRLVLSNGHICPVRYAAMALAGYFPLTELKTLRKIHSRLQGHPHRTSLPGLETTSGPLGEGLGQSVGIALAGKMDRKSYKTYCLTSDGEHEEGSIWEAVMSAGKYKLHNLIQIIDYNNIQIDGPVTKIMPLEPFKEKYVAFNWQVLEMPGNDMGEIIKTIEHARTLTEKPVLIIAHTTPGKGVEFMENDYTWHGKAPSVEEGEKALTQLRKQEESIKRKKEGMGN